MVSWYCKIDDVEHGPLAQEELVKMAEAGRLKGDDLVRNDQKDKWYKAKKVKGLIPVAEEDEETSVKSKKRSRETSSSDTSSQAIRLLEGLKKSKRDRDSGEMDEDVGIRAPTDPKSRVEYLSSLGNTKGTNEFSLDKRSRIVLIVGGIAVFAVILFPPFAAPDNVDYASGRHSSFLFTPPNYKINLEENKVSADDRKKLTVFGKYGYGSMGVNFGRLFLEILIVAAVFGGFFVFFYSKRELEGS